MSEKRISLADLSLPPIDIFEDDFDLDDTSGKLCDPMESVSVTPEVDDHTAEAYDNYLNEQVIAPLEGEMSKDTVLKRKLDRDDNPTCIRNEKPILDTRQYEV